MSFCPIACDNRQSATSLCSSAGVIYQTASCNIEPGVSVVCALPALGRTCDGIIVCQGEGSPCTPGPKTTAGVGATTSAILSTPSANAVATGNAASATGNPSTGSHPTAILATSSVSSNTESTITSAPRDQKIQEKNHNGTYAGIAIACLVGGALIAGLMFFLFFRRRKSAKQLLTRSPPVGAAGYSPKGYALDTVTPVHNGIDQYLPQPVEDNRITGELSKLRDNIKNHAQSYYHTLPVDSSQLNDASYAEVAAVLGLSSQSLKALLVDPSTRISGVRAGVAAIILSRFGGPRSAGGDSILPLEIAAAADSLPNLGSPDQVRLLSKSKVINGAIFQQQNKFSGDTAGGDRAVKAINDFVAPFVQSTDETRVKNLQGIIRRASQFAVLLYSQPSLWKFDWAANNSTSRGIVVMPALVQTVSDEAEVLTPSRVFSSEERVGSS